MSNFLWFDPGPRPATLTTLSVEERQMMIAQQTLDLEIAKFHWQQIAVVLGALVLFDVIDVKKAGLLKRFL